MKITRKFQNGGQSPIFATYNPILLLLAPAAQAAPSASTSKSSKGTSGVDLVLKMMDKIDGLPSDMNSITSQVSQLYLIASAIGDDSGDISGVLGALYVALNLLLKIAAFNKKEYDKMYLLASRKGSLDELVVSLGMVYAYNKDGKLQSVGISEYLKHRDEYSPITLGNLLWLRANDDLFANNNSVFNIMTGATSMEEVTKLIKANLGTLGSDSLDVTGYVNKGINGSVKTGLLVLQLLAELQGDAAVKGIYKVTLKSKTLLKQAEAAIQYIWASLTPAALDLLKVRGGDSKNPVKGALNIISLKVMAIMSNTISYSEDYQDDFNPDGTLKPKKGSGEGGDKPPKENTVFRYMNGRGYREIVNILPGDNYAGRVDAVTAQITDSEDKPFDGQYLNELLSSSFAPILDLTHATMGGNAIVDLQQVQLLENKAHSIFWPTLSDGITPDLGLDTTEAMKKADEEIEASGVEPGSPEAYQIKAKYIRGGQLRRFTVINGMTNNNALGIDTFDDTDTLEKVDDRTYQLYELKYQNYWSKGNNKQRLDLDHNQWYNPADWFGNYDEVYKGLIWIPHMDNYSNALSGTGKDISSEYANDYDKKQYISDEDLKANLNYNDPSLYE